MAKKSISKISSSSTKSSQSSQNSETPFSTGLFGHLHTGSIVSCKSDDNSFFCNLTKVFNGLLMIIGIFFILYLIYYYGKLFFFNKRK